MNTIIAKTHHHRVGQAQRSKGFTIVELMVAMLLGLVLVGGVIQVFITGKRSYAITEESAWLQENVRYALKFLVEDIRLAGYAGCASNATVANTLNDQEDNWQFNFNDGIFGYEGDDPDFPAEFPSTTTALANAASLPQSDVVTMMRGDVNDSLRVSGHNVHAAVIDVADPHGFASEDILMVSDCNHAAVFQITGGNPQMLGHNPGGSTSPGNCTKGLGLPVVCSANGTSYQYGSDAIVMEALGHGYYIDEAPNGVPTLYRRSLTTGDSTENEELAQGIENMQVSYGVDTDDDGVANRYVDADDVSDAQWAGLVVAARVELLARSMTPVSSEPLNFTFAGNNYTPNDQFLRKTFTTTVKIRNRGI